MAKNVPTIHYLTEKQATYIRKLSYIQKRTRSEIVREALDYYFKSLSKSI